MKRSIYIFIFGIFLFSIQSCEDKEILLPNNTFEINGEYNGGKIFYIDETGLHGLIADTSNQLSSSWGSNSTNTGATDLDNGFGKKNTEKIINTLGCYTSNAACLCNKNYIEGYNDWYLPSKGELDILFAQKDLVDGFTASNYWSSTEVFNNGGWNQNFTTGEQGENGKFDARSVRPIRAF